jgi:hypothetical protein
MFFMASLSEEGGSAQSAAQGAGTATPMSGNKAKGHARGAGERSVLATGFLCSGALHGLLVAALVFSRGMTPATYVIPVDVVLVNEPTASPLQPDATVGPPRKEAIAPLPEDSTLASIPSPDKPADPLEEKLERLAELRDMDEHRPLPKSDVRSLHASRASSDAEATATTYAVSDFIRAQVERRWGLDVAALAGKALSVFVRVEITNTGAVTKAEIVRNGEFASDKTYQNAARSARNAVILSSPFTLPAGNYSTRMAFTLRLDTRDAVR